MWGECENKKAPQIKPVTHRSCRKQVNTTEAPVAATGKQCYNYFNAASTKGRLVKCNTFFLELCQNKYQDFLAKQTVKNMRAAFNEKRIYGVLSAYKLFYVGCSRARRNLTILLDRSKMQGDIELQLLKFKALGFEVICN